MTCKPAVPEIAFTWPLWGKVHTEIEQTRLWESSRLGCAVSVPVLSLLMGKCGSWSCPGLAISLGILYLHLELGNPALVESRVAGIALHSQNEIILLVPNQNSLIRHLSAVVCIYLSSIPCVKVCCLHLSFTCI